MFEPDKELEPAFFSLPEIVLYVLKKFVKLLMLVSGHIFLFHQFFIFNASNDARPDEILFYSKNFFKISLLTCFS